MKIVVIWTLPTWIFFNGKFKMCVSVVGEVWACVCEVSYKGGTALVFLSHPHNHCWLAIVHLHSQYRSTIFSIERAQKTVTFYTKYILGNMVKALKTNMQYNKQTHTQTASQPASGLEDEFVCASMMKSLTFWGEKILCGYIIPMMECAAVKPESPHCTSERDRMRARRLWTVQRENKMASEHCK